ncbi:interleukin-6 receptor subunit beta-like [Erpetoichthys calabaricus]|uniref:interleukin-6 receptor subunit beta-like n=1 Tax=Erpetoichthys calabaricus TaxID=27687 RepID=UPI002234E377|nr:interleukin-6 receptor subunit beta-like [Erpetoichthys calabaricus]
MVNSSVHSLLLKGLSPNKVYTFFAEAITDGGSTAGPSLSVTIDVNDEQWTMLFPILLTVSLLLLMIGILACVEKMEILQKLLWPPVPDPGHSSLAHWMPKIFLDLGATQEQYGLKVETDVSANHKDISGTIQLLADDKFNVDLLGGHFKAGLSGEVSRMQSDVYPAAINCISEQGLCPTSIIFGDHRDDAKRPAITEQVEYSAILANGYMGLAVSPNPAVHVPLLPSLGTEDVGVLGEHQATYSTVLHN